MNSMPAPGLELPYAQRKQLRQEHGPLAEAVFDVIAAHWTGGAVDLSYSAIAAEANVGKSTVRKLIDALVNTGWLKREHNFADHRQQVNRYRIPVWLLLQRAPREHPLVNKRRDSSAVEVTQEDREDFTHPDQREGVCSEGQSFVDEIERIILSANRAWEIAFDCSPPPPGVGGSDTQRSPDSLAPTEWEGDSEDSLEFCLTPWVPPRASAPRFLRLFEVYRAANETTWAYVQMASLRGPISPKKYEKLLRRARTLILLEHRDHWAHTERVRRICPTCLANLGLPGQRRCESCTPRAEGHLATGPQGPVAEYLAALSVPDVGG